MAAHGEGGSDEHGKHQQRAEALHGDGDRRRHQPQQREPHERRAAACSAAAPAGSKTWRPAAAAARPARRRRARAAARRRRGPRRSRRAGRRTAAPRGAAARRARAPATTPSPTRPVTATAVPVSGPARASRAASAISAAGRERPCRRPEQQRRAGDRRQHEARKQAVRERLAGVGEALAQHPEAERAAEAAGEHQLERRAQLDPAHRLVVSWCWIVTARERAAPPRGRSARGRRWPRAWRGRAPRPAARTRPARRSGRARGRSRARSRRRGSRRAAPGPRRAAPRTASSISCALAGSTPASGSSSSSTGASWTSARASSARWRWPPDSSPNGLAASAARPDALERRRGGGAVGAARGQPPAPARQRAHQRHVQRGHREVEPGAFGLRHVGGPPGEPHRPARRLELARQRAEEGGLAAPVRAQHADALPGAAANVTDRRTGAPP